MLKQNRRFISLAIALFMVLGIIFPSMTFADAEEVHLTILGTTDIHGNIYNWSYEDGEETEDSGLAKVYSVVEAVRKENPNTILLDNGDTIQGTILTDDVYNADLEKPNPMIDVMNFMKYDAMTLGNHEFNFGLDLVHKIVEEAEFPMLGANIYNKADGSNFAEPYAIVERAGVKIGILGFTNPNIPRWDGAKVADLEFEALDKAAAKHIEELKKENVDIIIATAHAGLDTEYTEADSVRKVIENHPEIEAVLIGHSHSSVTELVGNTVVGGARDTGMQVVRMDLKLKKENDAWTVVDRDVELIEVEEYEASKELKEYAKAYHEATLEFISTVIGQATGDFHPKSEIKGIPEGQIRDTAVMDLINEVQLKYTDADVSAAALFSNSSNIEEGPITYASIFDIYKYPNTLKVVEVTGQELRDYMEWSVKYYNTFKPGDINISFDPNVRGYRYDMFAGVDYKIDISKPAGERITYLKFEGEDVKPNDTLKLVINDYRYSNISADGDGVISGTPIYESDPVSSRSLIAQHIEELGTLEPKVDNNWEIIGADLEHPLRDYIINEVNEGRIEIPKSEDGRTWNVKALNVYELIEEGLIPDEVLKEHNIEVPERPNTIDIVSFNDFHGNVADSGKNIGMAKMIGYTKSLLKKNPNTIFVSGGDSYQGTAMSNLTFGEPVSAMMKAMGVEASAVGNHEFDWGVEYIEGWAKDGGFDFLATNIVDAETKEPVDWAKPYKIIERNGVKIGLIGLAHEDTDTLTKKEFIDGLEFTDAVEAAKTWVKYLKDGKAEEGTPDIILALTHIDSNQDSETEEITGNAVDLAAVEGLDGIISAHSHRPVAGKVNGKPIVQAGYNGRMLGILSIELDEDNKVVGIEAKLDDVSSKTEEIVPDPEGVKMFEEFLEITEPILGEVIGEAAGEFGHNSREDNVTLLGRWSSEMMKKAAGVQIAIQNGGGLRRTLEAGTITMGDLYEIMPFDNTMVTMELKGEDIKRAIDLGIDNPNVGNGQFAGLIVEYNKDAEFQNRVVSMKLEDGTPVEMGKYYTVTTNDFLLTGGDKYDFSNGKNVVDTYIPIRDILVDAIKEEGTITPVEVDYLIAVEEEASTVVKQYEVKKGDVLYRIGIKFNTTWEALAEFNKLTNPHLIYPGQLINIPY